MSMRIWVFMLAVLLCCMPCLADGSATVLDEWASWPQTEAPVDLQDVPWAQEAIAALGQYGLIQTENGCFYPKRAITRAEFTKLLIGAFGMYNAAASCGFLDVPEDDPYYGYIASAYELGVIKGYSDTWFARDGHLTREDLAVMIYRMGVLADVPFENRPALTFADASDIAGYAVEAVRALAGAQAVSGDDANRFCPKNYATRAEACKIIYYLLLK